MRARCFAFVVALLFAVGPAMGVVCEVECDNPPASSSPCHSAAAANDGARVRGIAHACGSAHLAAPPALLTGSSPRAQVVTIIAASTALVARASLPALALGARAAMHGPPGLTSRSTTSFTTVLRI